MGIWDPDAEMQWLSRGWDTASLWLFTVVPLADKLLSEKVEAYIFHQPKTDIEEES